jgi:hypothetical protein
MTVLVSPYEMHLGQQTLSPLSLVLPLNSYENRHDVHLTPPEQWAATQN